MILHSKLNSKKLIFKVVNATYSPMLEKIKSYASSNMIVEFDYHHCDFEEIVYDDLERCYIGLFIVTGDFLDKNIELFYELKLPIFKVSQKGFFTIKESVFLGSNSKVAEKVSSIIFDISSQLGSEIALFDVHLENSQEQDKIISHFQNLAKLFEKRVKIIKTKQNPILKLKERDDFLQFIVFDKSLLSSKLISYFSTDIEKHYFRLRNNYQLFIPSES
jgi:hypothetical protein